MNERELLLAAILRQPDDLTLRLAYADWLDEHPELPAATASAEFIRVACKGTKTNKGLPRASYPWFKENWRRLIPSVAAMSVPPDETRPFEERVNGIEHAEVKGSRLATHVALPGFTSRGTKVYPCTLLLAFHRGLLCYWKMPSPWGRRQVEPALRADQPQLFLEPLPQTFGVGDLKSA